MELNVKRSMEFMIQLYVKNAKEAIELYKKAFGATVIFIDHTPENDVLHSELLVCGQKIAIADNKEEVITGSLFQICVRMQDESNVRMAYETLKEGSKTNVELGPTFFSSLMVDFIDKFGVRWCIFQGNVE